MPSEESLKLEEHARLRCDQQLHQNASFGVMVPLASQQNGLGSMHKGQHHSVLAMQQDHDNSWQHVVF